MNSLDLSSHVQVCELSFLSKNQNRHFLKVSILQTDLKRGEQISHLKTLSSICQSLCTRSAPIFCNFNQFQRPLNLSIVQPWLQDKKHTEEVVQWTASFLSWHTFIHQFLEDKNNRLLLRQKVCAKLRRPSINPFKQIKTKSDRKSNDFSF